MAMNPTWQSRALRPAWVVRALMVQGLTLAWIPPVQVWREMGQQYLQLEAAISLLLAPVITTREMLA